MNPYQIQSGINRLNRLIKQLRIRYGAYAHLMYDELLVSNVRQDQIEEVWAFVAEFKGTRKRKWRMVYGWRNNPAASAAHFVAAALFYEAARHADKIAERLPIFKFRADEARVKSTFECAQAYAALVDKWVRVGTAHRWEVR